MNLQEENEEYHVFEENNLNIKYREIIEYLFKDKERIRSFLNCFSDSYEKIEEEKLVYMDFYKSQKGIRIIYKHLDRQIFYMIMYQQEILLDLPYVVLQECIKIIQNCKQKNIKNISIIPIVIYVKDNICPYRKTIKQCFQITTYDKHILELKYNLINVLKFLKYPNMKNTILEDLIYIDN